MPVSAGPMELNDPREVIARSPMSTLQVLVIAVTVALNALDGFDVDVHQLRLAGHREGMGN